MSDSQWHQDQAVGERAQRKHEEEQRTMAARLEAVRLALEGFEAEVKTREDQLTGPRGGQSVTPAGDFVSAPPSVVVRLRWWAGVFRHALERP